MKKYLWCILIVVLILVFLVVILSSKNTKYMDRNINEWINDINNGKEVVTVFGASFCSHCKEYKPIITSLADKNGINLYFYEIDTMNDSDREKLLNSFEIGDYDGSVPYTFIIDKKEYKDSVTGYSDKEVIISFLKDNKIIEN